MCSYITKLCTILQHNHISASIEILNHCVGHVPSGNALLASKILKPDKQFDDQ